MIVRKSLTVTVTAALIFTSCGKIEEAPSTNSPEKSSFFFESQKFREFSKTAEIEKIGRIVGSSAVTVTSQGNGRIVALPFKEGMYVRKGEALARLTDTIGNYSLRFDQAKNGLKNTEVTIESTKISLDKAVSDAEIALSRAQIDYERTLADAEKQLEKAKRDSERTVLNSSGSDSQSTLAKAELDYRNLLESNAKTIENYGSTYRVSVSDLKKLTSQVLFDSDRLLWVTDANRNYNDGFETYLWARDSSILPQAQAAYPKVLAVATLLDTKNQLLLTEANATSEFLELEKLYAVIRNLLNQNVRLLEYSIASGSFPQTTIDTMIATHNGYKSSLSVLESGFVAFKNSATAFLTNYRNSEASAAAALDLQRKNLTNSQYDTNVAYERTKITLDAGIQSAALSLESAKSNLQNAQRNRENTLERLEVSKTDSNLQFAQATTELSKLTIVSPIDASIARIFAQVGQEVSLGTPIAEISTKTSEVVIDVDNATAELLQVGSNVRVTSDSDSYTGTVVAVSKVANQSLLFTVRIALAEIPKLLGGAATVKIPLQSPYPVISTDFVKILSEQTGELTAYSGGTFVAIPVKLGKISSGKVEILDDLEDDWEIVLSDVSNFDPKKSEPKKK